MLRTTTTPHSAALFLISTALLAGCSSAPEAPPVVESGPYPATPRVGVVDEYHGTVVADPYRWLEDPDSAETRAWIEAQNEVTRAHLEEIDGRAAIAEQVAALWTYERFGTPSKHGDWYYFSYDDGTLNQPQIVRSRALGEPHEVVLDPNTFSEDGTVSLGGMSYSHDGRYLAYGTSDGGSDWRLWRIRDLKTGEDLPDLIDWARFSSPSWAADDSGFYYGRYPETDERLTAPALNQAVYFHTLGQNQSEDALIHEDPEHPERGFSAFTSRDGRWLMMWVREGTARKNRLWFKDLAAGPRSPWNKRFDDFDAQYVPLGNVGSIVWLRTDLDAPMGRVVTVDASIPKAPLIEIVPEADAVLSAASYVGDRLFLTYLEDALTRVRTVDPSGNALGDVELPGVGTASGFGGEIGDEETFFGFSAYTSPTSTYRFDVATGAVTLVQRPRVPFDSDAYETEQIFFSSKDGTRVPMFLTYRKGLERDGSHPTLLYGYGGFNISMRPGFSPANAAWLDMGGVYAVACLRGGGEYGREWHQAGTKERKQNVFDDFIAAAEHLVDTGVTRPERLGIFGGSNGGLLVGACVNQRPDLYGAAIPAVGVMDMLRYHRFTIGAAWASDYGRSDDPEMFPYLYAYSPYHNATPGTSYPAIMVTTADHDDRVVPAHSFKYASAMQFAQAGDEPVLIRIDTRAGHGAGKSRQQSIEEVADRWAFFAHHLGLEVAAP
ncbi:MAG: prolyl oligopeptidase family serine peptidase [Planctomycetota bacterium]